MLGLASATGHLPGCAPQFVYTGYFSQIFFVIFLFSFGCFFFFFLEAGEQLTLVSYSGVACFHLSGA